MLPDEYVQDVNLRRCNIDQTVNEYGKILLDFCKMSELRQLNGRLGSDINIGKHTFVSSQGCSTIIIVLCKNDMFPLIHKF